MSTKFFNVKGGLTTGNITISDANVTLGAVGNVHISGGTDGYLLRTDGAGGLTWVDAQATQSAAPMPYIVFTGDTLTIPEFYQGLYSMPITVDGTIVINGYLVEV